jgi:hypothetical protein
MSASSFVMRRDMSFGPNARVSIHLLFGSYALLMVPLFHKYLSDAIGSLFQYEMSLKEVRISNMK